MKTSDVTQRFTMRRNLVVVWALALGLAVAVSGLAWAEATESPAAQDPTAAWEETLEGARAELVGAQARLAKAEAAYQDWRQRKYPRGARKAELLAEIEEARSGLADAEAAYPEVLETLRRAGAPAGLLRRFERPPAAPER